MTYFMLSERVVTDMYIFDANEWHMLGGDFLFDPSPSMLEEWLKENGVDLNKIDISYK